MAKRTKEEIMADFAKIGASKLDETSQRIMAGIEASKKRNAELAKDVDKRRAEYEAKQKAAQSQQKAVQSQQTTAETRPKKSPSVPTKVRSSKGGAMTAEVDDTKATQQKKVAEAKKQEASKPRRVLSASDSEAQKERAAKGARRTRTLAKVYTKLANVSEDTAYTRHKRNWGAYHRDNLAIENAVRKVSGADKKRAARQKLDENIERFKLRLRRERQRKKEAD